MHPCHPTRVPPLSLLVKRPWPEKLQMDQVATTLGQAFAMARCEAFHRVSMKREKAWEIESADSR